MFLESTIQNWAAAFVAFVALWMGIGEVPHTVLSPNTKGYIYMALGIIFGTVVNLL